MPIKCLPNIPEYLALAWPKNAAKTTAKIGPISQNPLEPLSLVEPIRCVRGATSPTYNRNSAPTP